MCSLDVEWRVGLNWEGENCAEGGVYGRRLKLILNGWGLGWADIAVVAVVMWLWFVCVGERLNSLNSHYV